MFLNVKVQLVKVYHTSMSGCIITLTH